jgi:hypothetical protein
LPDNRIIRQGELFLGRDGGGGIHIILWMYTKVYHLRGSMENGFHAPELIWDVGESEYRINDLSAAVGADGTLYFAWEFFSQLGDPARPAFFGRLPQKA